MANRLQIRRGTAASATLANPLLAEGEMGWETDTLQYKMGDGVTLWNSLPYGGTQGIKGDTGDEGPTGPIGPEGDVAFDGGTWDTVYQLDQIIDGGAL